MTFATVRKWQQSKLVQIVLVPIIITAVGTFISAALLALLAVSHGDISTLTAVSFKTALGMGGFAALTYIGGIIQHGLGSASFHEDGTPNKAVNDIVKIQVAAANGHPQVQADLNSISSQASAVAAQVAK